MNTLPPTPARTERVGCPEVGDPQRVRGAAAPPGAGGGRLHAQGGEHRCHPHGRHPAAGGRHDAAVNQVPEGRGDAGGAEQREPLGLHYGWCSGVPGMEQPRSALLPR